jgi:hypothetical protein
MMPVFSRGFGGRRRRTGASAPGLFRILLTVGPATARPPPGHPEAHHVPGILGLPDSAARLSRNGRVIQALPGNRSSCILVEEAGRRHWIAAPRADLAPDVRIRFPDGRVMRNLYREVLQRTFESLLFVRRVQVVHQGI